MGMPADALGEAPGVCEGDARPHPELRAHRMSSVSDQNDATASPNDEWTRNDDVAVARGEQAGGGDSLDERAEVPGERPGSVEPGFGPVADHGLDRPNWRRPE